MHQADVSWSCGRAMCVQTIQPAALCWNIFFTTNKTFCLNDQSINEVCIKVFLLCTMEPKCVFLSAGGTELDGLRRAGCEWTWSAPCDSPWRKRKHVQSAESDSGFLKLLRQENVTGDVKVFDKNEWFMTETKRRTVKDEKVKTLQRTISFRVPDSPTC